MSAGRTFRRIQSTPARAHEFWKYHWIVYHKTIRALRDARRHAHGVLLDVGCGAKPFAYLFDGRVARYWGSDLRGSRYLEGARGPDVYARSEALPFRDASVDTVLGLSMLTYLPEPLEMIREANRVLKPGGVLLLEFTQMVPLHDAPWDFFRFTRHGARYLLERGGFEALEVHPIGGLWTRVALSAMEPLNRLNRGPWRVLTELPVRALYVGIQLGGEALDRVFFDPREVIGHLVVARKVRAALDDDPARAVAAATRAT